MAFIRNVDKSNKSDRRFSFLNSSDPYHAFYQQKLTEYREARNQDGVVQSYYDDAQATRECVAPECESPPLREPLVPFEPHSFAL